MGSSGFPEWIWIVVVAFIVFVVFGPKNLPKLGKMFGSTMKEVRKGMSEFSEEMQAADEKPAAVQETPRKIAQVVYEDEIEEVKIDPNRKVAKIIYEDETEA